MCITLCRYGYECRFLTRRKQNRTHRKKAPPRICQFPDSMSKGYSAKARDRAAICSVLQHAKTRARH